MADDPIQLEIDPSGMLAVLRLPAHATLPASALIDRLMKAGVVAGVVESALQEVGVASDADRALAVAKGVPAVLPVDAHVQLLVDFALRLAEDAEHKIDFREQGRFHEVDADVVLARLVPKQPGTPGRTILGKDLVVGEARDADLSAFAGEGTLVRGGSEVVTERAGMVVRRRDGHLDIMPAVDIPGDLDMHWGNLVTKLPVSVRGDVIAGFSLKSGADVVVRGVIEDARVSVRGNLTCGGLLQGVNRVKTHGDLTTKHVTGREVKCHNLIVSSDIRGSQVFAIGNVTAKLIVSSKITCGGSLTCEELGNRDEMGGTVQVGTNPLAIALWRLAAREHEAISNEVSESKGSCKRIALWVKQEDDPAKRQELAHRLKDQLASYERRARRLSECESVLNNAVLRAGNSPDATVTVQQVHPGVEIMIGAEAKLVVSKTMGKTVFRLKDGKVAWDIANDKPADPPG